MEVNLEFLIEMDQLVQLIESPAFISKYKKKRHFATKC